jgi:hypothetical protein
VVADGEGEETAVGDGFVAGTSIPLFQTKFFPDLMQVNFLPCDVFTCPLVGHLAPAFTAANAGSEREDPRKVMATNNEKAFFMAKRVLSHIGFVCHTL